MQGLIEQMLQGILLVAALGLIFIILYQISRLATGLFLIGLISGLIFIEVYGFDKDSDSSCIREHIKNIRAKLTKYIESPITTVWGIGYKWI